MRFILTYCCKECGNVIKYTTALYGTGLCKSCSHSGKRNSNYKDGSCINLPYCIDCKKQLPSFTSKRCIKCFKKYIKISENNSNYKGKKLKFLCDYCGKIVLRRKCQNTKSKHIFCDSKCYAKYLSIHNKGKNNPMYGKKRLDVSGKNCHMYIDGKGNFPYTNKFNKSLKYKIRERDRFKCQKCGLEEINHFMLKRKVNLLVHHIDYDKENCKENNLIALCCSCHTSTNHNRDYWFAYFTYIIERLK